MSDSNATERLRAMLDERGVGYDIKDGKAVKNTYWNVGDLRFGYCEQIYEDGLRETDLFMYRGYGCTPEQAVAATLGAGECVPKERFDELAEAYDKMADQSASLAAELNARAEPPYDKLLRCLENDYGITASWDGLRKFWYVEQKPEKPCGGNYCPLCGANERTCEIVEWYEARDRSEIGNNRVRFSCGHFGNCHDRYCAKCGARVVKGDS